MDKLSNGIKPASFYISIEEIAKKVNKDLHSLHFSGKILIRDT